MTAPHSTHRARPVLREQAVAAMVVGAVVILLGFASGLGLDPAASTSTAAPPAATAPAAPPATAAGGPTATTPAGAPPVAYVAEPAPPVAPVAIAAPPSESTAPVSSAAPTTPAPSAGSTGASGSPSSQPSTPGTGSGTPPSCSPGLISALLETLLPGSTDNGGLLGLGSLLQSVDQLAGATQLLSNGSGGLLDQITGLLALPSVLPGGHASKALATSCTADVQNALTLIAAGSDVPTAVQKVAP